jgi:ABC-type multidrug transport system fused ATPase/permease subunit
MDNIRYAKLNASKDEVYEACKAAAIHDRILQFKLGLSKPSFTVGSAANHFLGYNTKVGIRGG